MYRVQFSIKDGVNDGTFIIAETPFKDEAVKALREGKKNVKKVIAAYEVFAEYYGGLTDVQQYNYEYEKAKLAGIEMVNLTPKKSKKVAETK